MENHHVEWENQFELSMAMFNSYLYVYRAGYPTKLRAVLAYLLAVRPPFDR